MNQKKIKIAVAKGDGIGPEIMDAVIRILKATDLPLEFEEVDMGKSIFDKGHSTGMTAEAREIVEKHGILLKGPMETPKGSGVKSINVTARKIWNTYANIRRFKSLEGVDTIYSRSGIPIDLTVIRENIEDTYSGIEYKPSDDVAIAQRLISREGCRQLMRYSFKWARQEGIHKVTCGHKANIMKMTDGLFLDTFYEVAKEFPEIQTEDVIIDDLAMKMVMAPQNYEMIVLTNLQGDIMSDQCAGLVGGLGFAPSANLGDNISIFEAVHGTAPDISGKNLANPTSLLLSSLMMLRRLGATQQADAIENSLHYCLEQDIRTGDFGKKEIQPCGTDEFADYIIKNLGRTPERTKPRSTPRSEIHYTPPVKPEKSRVMFDSPKPESILEGVDIYVTHENTADDLAKHVKQVADDNLELSTISNRGTQVWPEASVFTDCISYYQLRFRFRKSGGNKKNVFDFVSRLSEQLDVSEVIFLTRYGKTPGYSAAQGE